MSTERSAVVAIGAGFCGLALGAALRTQGIDDFVIVEQGADVGHFWTTTYERLHLHSAWHGLPHDDGLNARYPMFKSRNDLVDYFRHYAERHQLYRHLQVGRRVLRVARIEPASNNGCEWRVETTNGVYAARYLVVATALNRAPVVPALAGDAVYRGQLLHSAAYRNAAPFAGQRVLVVGSGNSAAEIALDLVEHGAAEVFMWVRRPRHFVPRRAMAWLFRVFRALGMTSEERFAVAHRTTYGTEAFWKLVRQRDAVTRPFSVDLTRFGIRKPTVGPQEDAMRHGRIAVFDVGAIPAIRAGRIRIVDGNVRPIGGLTPHGVRLGEHEERFDAVILATGYEPRLEEFISHREMLGPVRWWRSAPLTDGRSRSRIYPSAFFPGFDMTVNGGLSLGPWGWEAGERIAAELRG
jgi:indole-3-pyruvate monooxygenase